MFIKQSRRKKYTAYVSQLCQSERGPHLKNRWKYSGQFGRFAYREQPRGTDNQLDDWRHLLVPWIKVIQLSDNKMTNYLDFPTEERLNSNQFSECIFITILGKGKGARFFQMSKFFENGAHNLVLANNNLKCS